MMAWRQLDLTAEQQKQLMLSSPFTPHINSSSLLTLHDMMLKHQQRFEKRRLSENDLEMDKNIKLPKLSPIGYNTCSSSSLTLPFTTMSFMSNMRAPDEAMSLPQSNAFVGMSQREKAQNQQYLERLRRMNERGRDRLARSRVNYEPHNSAKTVREELAACRNKKSKKGKRNKTTINNRLITIFIRHFAIEQILQSNNISIEITFI